MSEPPRSREARALAESALVRLVRAYGATPEFVLLGGLVPDLLCSGAPNAHQGTTDVDVQVDLEIAGGAVNAARLEAALTEVGFTPDSEKVWRWRDKTLAAAVIKIEFLADLDYARNGETVKFNECEHLGAANLRGTGFAARDWDLRTITSTVDGKEISVEVRVATLPAYLLAKAHAAYGRNLPKDWYDIAYVTLHNDDGGPDAAADRVLAVFAADLTGQTDTALSELGANFVDEHAQGAKAFAETMVGLHPDLDIDRLANDGVAAVTLFVSRLRRQ